MTLVFGVIGSAVIVVIIGIINGKAWCNPCCCTRNGFIIIFTLFTMTIKCKPGNDNWILYISLIVIILVFNYGVVAVIYIHRSIWIIHVLSVVQRVILYYGWNAIIHHHLKLPLEKNLSISLYTRVNMDNDSLLRRCCRHQQRLRLLR